MKKKTLTVLFALAALSAGAQSKFDPMSLMRLQSLRSDVAVSAKQSGKPFKALAQEKKIKVAVLMNDGVDAASLVADGFELTASRKEVGVVELPLSRVYELNAVADVKSISYDVRYTPRLSEAHKVTGVNKVHSGEGLSLPYKGKGVLIADFDQGFDPAHAFFLDKDGKTRVVYYEKDGKQYTTQEDIIKAGTDDNETYHAAHVMGIAAGYYSDNNFTISGVAPEADIAVSAIKTGTNTEVIELTERLVKFAKERKEPLVLNYSLGSNVGFHDNSDSFVKYMNTLIASNDAIVCVAAGNEGKKPVVQKHTMQSDDDVMKAYMYCIRLKYTPACMIIADGPDAFDVSLVVYDNYYEKVRKRWDKLPASLTSEGDNADPDFKEYFTGTLLTESGTHDGKYYTAIVMQPKSDSNSGAVLGYEVKAKKGRNFVCYADAGTWLLKSFSAYSKDPVDDITYDGTINTMVTGMNGMGVGSFNTRDSGDYLNKDYYNLLLMDEDNKVGDVSSFSSWGTIDGVNYPDLVAPGALVESAATWGYFSEISEEKRKVTRKVEKDGKTHYWTVDMGTSMATPYMSGVAALWLEADPTLTMAQVKEIAKSTANKDEYFTKAKYPVQFGAGKIDAYNGLKKVLERKATGLRAVDADKDMLFRSTGDNTYEAYVAGETALTVNIYYMSGRRAYSQRTAGSSVEFSTASLPKGVYAVELCGGKTSHKVKIAVK